MVKYKITIQYNGKNFSGWQKQKNLITIQESLENIISDFLDEKIQISGASRTDAGVHALEQIAHFEIENNNHKIKPSFLNSLNFFLKAANLQIIVAKIEKVDSNFHARFTAKTKTYVYRVINQRFNTLFDDIWHVKQKLNLFNMILAAQQFIGKHDFTSFRAKSCQAKSPIRTIEKIIFIIKPKIFSYENYTLEIDYFNQNNFKNDIKIPFNLEDCYIEIYFVGKSFLHHMIRNIVGTLIYVGLNKIKYQDIADIINAKDRNLAGLTAPSHGLTLLEIKY